MSNAAWKSPPKAKIYEALSAVADGRVQIVGEGEALVHSSDQAKTYKVIWNKERTAFGANDNASYWVGYVGYPIIATLFELGVIELDRELAGHFQSINWNKLNQIYKRRYDDAVNYVLEQLQKNNIEIGPIREFADASFEKLKSLKFGRLTPPGEPPKKG
ncbi:MAG: hypothetical protein WB764_16460 [Xanthobacteraceae bacterium]